MNASHGWCLTDKQTSHALSTADINTVHRHIQSWEKISLQSETLRSNLPSRKVEHCEVIQTVQTIHRVVSNTKFTEEFSRAHIASHLSTQEKTRAALAMFYCEASAGR